MTATALDFPVKEFGGCDSTAIGTDMMRTSVILADTPQWQVRPILAIQIGCLVAAMLGLLLTAH